MTDRPSLESIHYRQVPSGRRTGLAIRVWTAESLANAEGVLRCAGLVDALCFRRKQGFRLGAVGAIWSPVPPAR